MSIQHFLKGRNRRGDGVRGEERRVEVRIKREKEDNNNNTENIMREFLQQQESNKSKETYKVYLILRMNE